MFRPNWIKLNLDQILSLLLYVSLVRFFAEHFAKDYESKQRCTGQEDLNRELIAEGGLRAGLCSNVAFRFWFPYFQSLWGVSYLKFFIVDTKFHFTCGEQTVYVKLQGIIQRIVGSKSCNWPFSTTILNMVMSLTRKIQYRN